MVLLVIKKKMLQQRITSSARLPSMDYQSGSFRDRVRRISQMMVATNPLFSDSDQLDTIVSIGSQYNCSNDEDFTTLDTIDRDTCILLHEHTNHGVLNGTQYPTCHNLDSIQSFIDSSAQQVRMSNGLSVRTDEFVNMMNINQSLAWRHFQTKADNGDTMRIMEYVPRNIPINTSGQYPNDMIDVQVPSGVTMNVNRNELIQYIYQQLTSYDSSDAFGLPLLGNVSIRNKYNRTNIDSNNTSIDTLSISDSNQFIIRRLLIKTM